MVEICTIEPKSIRAGETWTWEKTLADYPAPTWVLTYTFFSAASVFSVVASASGSAHTVSVSAAASATKIAGRYDWTAQVSTGSGESIQRYRVGLGSTTILPNLAASTSYDGRSHARKVLEAINALIEGAATDGQLAVVQAVTGGNMSISYAPAELRKWQQQYAALVVAEDQAAAIARGDRSGRMIQVRFA
jgi:hypothetical protein